MVVRCLCCRPSHVNNVDEKKTFQNVKNCYLVFDPMLSNDLKKNNRMTLCYLLPHYLNNDFANSHADSD